MVKTLETDYCGFDFTLVYLYKIKYHEIPYIKVGITSGDGYNDIDHRKQLNKRIYNERRNFYEKDGFEFPKSSIDYLYYYVFDGNYNLDDGYKMEQEILNILRFPHLNIIPSPPFRNSKGQNKTEFFVNQKNKAFNVVNEYFESRDKKLKKRLVQYYNWKFNIESFLR